MTFRQFMVCLTVGPVCGFWLLVGVLGIAPLMLAVAALAGDDDPLTTAWEIATEPMIEMFKSFYRGEV